MNKANRSIHLMPYPVKEKFYQVKKQLLSKKGIPDGCDWQHIPGKKCFSCYNGIFIHLY